MQMIIYKCIKLYQNIMPGTYWAAHENHHMFQKIESPSGLERVFKYFPQYILDEYFIRLVEEKNEK